jgi:hypothetical protein
MAEELSQQLGRCLRQAWPQGVERVEVDQVVDRCRQWGREHGNQDMAEASAVGIGRVLSRMPGVTPGRSKTGRWYRIDPSVTPEAISSVTHADPLAAQHLSPTTEVAPRASVTPDSGSSVTHVAPPSEEPELELAWCSKTSSLHRVLSRYGPEVTVSPPLPGYPVGDGFSVVPSNWLIKPTAEQLAQGVQPHQPPATAPVVVSDVSAPVVPAPVKPKRVELLPVAIAKAQTPPPGSRGWGDVLVQVNGKPWLLRASRLHNGQEWALLVSADGKKAGACLFEGVELIDVINPPNIDAAAQALAKTFDGVVVDHTD